MDRDGKKMDMKQRYRDRESCREIIISGRRRGDNIYSFPYNGPGFEIPSILCGFSDIYNDIIDIDNEVKYWLDLQFSRTFYASEFMFSRNNPDPPTLTSRIYELLRFSDERIFNYEISLNEKM